MCPRNPMGLHWPKAWKAEDFTLPSLPFYFLQSGNLMTPSNINYWEHWQGISWGEDTTYFMTSFEKLHCCCSVAQSCLILCDPMDRSMPGFPVFHHLLELAQTHVHQVDDVIQQSHPLSSPSISSCLQYFPASGSFPLSWLFASGGQCIGASTSASVLPINIRGLFPFGLTGLISLLSKGLSSIFSNTTVWKHQFFSAQPFLWSNSHICTWLFRGSQRVGHDWATELNWTA